MQAHWTAHKIHSTRIDKILKELYKSLTKYSKLITDKLGEPHKLLSCNSKLINLYALHLISVANELKAPWEKFRNILQQAEDEDE
jgi:hypothetical protein